MKASLNEEQRHFFHLVSDAIYANPFSDSRHSIDRRIAGMFPEASAEKIIDRTVQEVSGRLIKLEKKFGPDTRCFFGRDRELVDNAIRFDFFYKYREQFDQAIIQQINHTNTPIKISFGDKAIHALVTKGFSKTEALKFFALCFQLRRAFYFIRNSLIGTSHIMKDFRKNLWDNVFTHDIVLYDTYLWNRMEDFSTLLLGETGTGKGTAAMAIGRSGFIPFDAHNKSFTESFTHSFVSLNLSQFPEALLESELFGHKKGSFTGAVDDHSGIFENCSPHGAIFLDEIGEISQHVQIKLLQVLQERRFTPVGSHREARFHGRVITATNKTLYEIRNQSIFRDDFYYRLCSDIITVPSLRERIAEDKNELNELVRITIRRIIGYDSENYTNIALQTIDKNLGDGYRWPGNVRELEQCVRRILLKKTYRGDKITSGSGEENKLIDGIRNGNIDTGTLLSGYIRLLYARHKTYEKVASITGLDRRTVKKYLVESIHQSDQSL